MKTMSFEAALREAQNRGYRTYIEPMVGIHRDIDEALEELDEIVDPEDYREDYIIFGDIIVSLADAWSRDADVYTLEF